MIRWCTDQDFDAILDIVNDGAEAYRSVIPPDRWNTPYMPSDELRHEMAEGVAFRGYERGGALVGVMGTQPVRDVRLIRHAYVRTAHQRRGAGGALLEALCAENDRPLLVGTWAAAKWAVRFYEKHEFELVDRETKDSLLQTYWTVPPRQIETSVVLADQRWLKQAATQTGAAASEASPL